MAKDTSQVFKTIQESASMLLVERLAELYKKFCIVMGVVAGSTVAVMMMSTTIDASFRYLFERPVAGVFELNEVILVVCVYMGLAWTQIQRGHIRVTLVLQNVSERKAVIIDMMTWVVSFIWVSILAYQSALGAMDSIRIWEFRWGSVQMPIWWAKSLVPIGCLMLDVQLVLDIWKDVERLRGRLPLELLTSRES